MTGFYGADTDQLRQFAGLMSDRATAIADLRSRLQPLVHDESAWTGPDADHFREVWASGPGSRITTHATTDGAERDVTIPGEEVDRTLSAARSVSVLTSIHADDGRRATFAATPGALYLVDDGDLRNVPTSGTREATMGALSPARLQATLSVLVPVIGADEG